MEYFKKDNNDKKDSLISDFRRNTELFHGNQDLYIIFKRIQNIVAALFLVTGEFEEAEELKNSLRKTSLEAIQEVSKLVQYPQLDISLIRNVAGPVLELNSLIRIAFWSGVITEMNAVILQKEIHKIEVELHDVLGKYQNKYLISSALFKDVEEIEMNKNVLNSELIKQNVFKGQGKRQIIKDSIKDNKAQPARPHETSTSDTRIQRKNAILKLLGERSNLSVKDFVAVIPEYSEKTIQRELLALVAEGVVKKQGERRWSTYSLA